MRCFIQRQELCINDISFCQQPVMHDSDNSTVASYLMSLQPQSPLLGTSSDCIRVATAQNGILFSAGKGKLQRLFRAAGQSPMVLLYRYMLHQGTGHCSIFAIVMRGCLGMMETFFAAICFPLKSLRSVHLGHVAQAKIFIHREVRTRQVAATLDLSYVLSCLCNVLAHNCPCSPWLGYSLVLRAPSLWDTPTRSGNYGLRQSDIISHNASSSHVLWRFTKVHL